MEAEKHSYSEQIGNFRRFYIIVISVSLLLILLTLPLGHRAYFDIVIIISASLLSILFSLLSCFLSFYGIFSFKDSKWRTIYWITLLVFLVWLVWNVRQWIIYDLL